MENSPKASQLRVHSAADYRIRIQGTLDPCWSNRLGGVTIYLEERTSSSNTVTILEGKITDQAALFGLLVALYDLRLPLLSVECIASR